MQSQIEMTITDNEKWVPIQGYEGIYEISNLGNLRSIERFVISELSRIKERRLKGKQMKKFLTKKGYFRISLRKGLSYKKFFVHRLVALSFGINKPDGKDQINHINGIESDNRLENLEWCNQSENQQHSYRNGRTPWNKGLKNPYRKGF